LPSIPGRATVRFDELACEEDIDRLSPKGRDVVARAREEFERHGVPLEWLRACQDEHDSGTSLPGCVKVYLPDLRGHWRMIFQLAVGEAGFLLSYLSAGVGHQPRGAGAPDAYQIAHHRMHGRWPRRTQA
jgi:hypothetical protein